jgi:hypothetical protein
MERVGLARSNVLLAAEGIHALARGEDSEDAELGAVLVAEFLLSFRM